MHQDEHKASLKRIYIVVAESMILEIGVMDINCLIKVATLL